MIKFTPPSMPLNCYDNTELAPCHESNGTVERLESNDSRSPSFWSVYLHLREGGVECVADFPDEPAAERFEEFMNALIVKERKDGVL